MEKLIKSSLSLLGKVDFSKYGWVLTTASIVAYLCLQKSNRSSSDCEDDNEGEDNPQEEKEGEQEEEMKYSERSKREGGCVSTTDDSSKNGVQNNQRIKGQQQQMTSLQREEQQMQLDNKERNKIQGSSFNNNNSLKKQYLENDKKLKKFSSNRSNNSSSSNLNTKSPRARKLEFGESNNKVDWDGEEEYTQTYAYSDIESRSFLQAKQQNTLRKQRRYTSDTEETSQEIRRNRILKIARESAPNDGIFFQVLASLAENDEEND